MKADLQKEKDLCGWFVFFNGQVLIEKQQMDTTFPIHVIRLFRFQ